MLHVKRNKLLFSSLIQNLLLTTFTIVTTVMSLTSKDRCKGPRSKEGELRRGPGCTVWPRTDKGLDSRSLPFREFSRAF